MVNEKIIKEVWKYKSYYKYIILYTVYIYLYIGVKDDWDFRISDMVKNPDGTDI